MENKRKKSIRVTNKLLKKEKLNSSYESIPRALKDDIGLKPWKVTRSQKITPTQRRERVQSARKLLERLGTTPTKSNSKWKRLLNTDFSTRISLVQKHNIKNTVIWFKNKRTIPPDLQTVGEEKYSPALIPID